MSFSKSLLVPVEKYKKLLEAAQATREQKPVQVAAKPLDQASHRPDVETRERPDTQKQAWLSQLSADASERAESLLRHIERTGALRWDDEGRIFVRGRFMPDTNIRDLVTDCVVEDKRPAGYMDFCEALAKSDTPPRLLANRPRRLLIDDLREENTDDDDEDDANVNDKHEENIVQEEEKEPNERERTKKHAPWINW